MAGLKCFATGELAVYIEAPQQKFDVSADLQELAKKPSVQLCVLGRNLF